MLFVYSWAFHWIIKYTNFYQCYKSVTLLLGENIVLHCFVNLFGVIALHSNEQTQHQLPHPLLQQTLHGTRGGPAAAKPLLVNPMPPGAPYSTLF